MNIYRYIVFFFGVGGWGWLLAVSAKDNAYQMASLTGSEQTSVLLSCYRLHSHSNSLICLYNLQLTQYAGVLDLFMGRGKIYLHNNL